MNTVTIGNEELVASLMESVKIGNKSYIATSCCAGLNKGNLKKIQNQLKMLYVSNPKIKDNETLYTACLEGVGYCVVDMDVTVDKEPKGIYPLPVACKYTESFEGGVFFGIRPMF